MMLGAAAQKVKEAVGAGKKETVRTAEDAKGKGEGVATEAKRKAQDVAEEAKHEVSS